MQARRINKNQLGSTLGAYAEDLITGRLWLPRGNT